MKTITLETGEKIAYDDLVLATGTGGPFPAKIPLDTNRDKAIERYEDYTKLVSVDVRERSYAEAKCPICALLL